MKGYNFFLGIFLPLLFSGCTAKFLPNNEQLNFNSVNFGNGSAWKVNGMIAVQSETESFSAAFKWVQTADNNFQIRLFAPLVNKTVMIEKKDHQLKYHDGIKTLIAATPEQLLQEQTTMRMPVTKLLYWMKGIPAPGAFQIIQSYADSHQLKVLQQAGYTINYLSYKHGSNFSYPERIKLQGNGMVIKLLIKRWQIV